MILNPPSPPYLDVCRDWAGGFGTAVAARGRGDYGHSGEPFFYPFLPYASAVLSNEDYSYSVLDCQRLKLDKFQVLRETQKRNPDVIFSLIALPSLKKDLELLDLIKKSIGNITIVGVGTSCRFLQSDILLNSKVDAVLRSGYPYVSSLALFLKALEQNQSLRNVPGISYVENGKLINAAESQEMSLNSLPFPKYSGLELDGYESFEDLDGNQYRYIPILGSKGCPYPCIYCPYPLGFGRTWTYRSPEDVVDEIEYLHSRGIKGFLFRDQSFAMNKERAVKVCETIISRKLDIAWFCEARVDHVSKGLLEKMKKAGCKQIHFGVETGDPELIKGGKPQTDLDTVRRAFSLTKEIGLYTMAHIVLGWPDETLETLEKTYRFLVEISPHEVNWNFLTPYPGTKLHEIAKKDNLILTNDWSKYTSHTVVMKTKYLNAEQLYHTAHKIIRAYSMRRMMQLLMHAREKPRFVLNEFKKIAKGYLT
jgi:radical SAM superfamily enzyme YgiQ (UPF0313 family)